MVPRCAAGCAGDPSLSSPVVLLAAGAGGGVVRQRVQQVQQVQLLVLPQCHHQTRLKCGLSQESEHQQQQQLQVNEWL